MTDIQTLAAFLRPEGREALAAAVEAAPDDASFLFVFQQLERRFPRDLARAAVEQAILRKKATRKFPHAERMYFQREALEQASSQVVADWRSLRYRDSRRIFDMGCGIGGDALSLSSVAPVVAIDQDELRLALLKLNASSLDCSSRLLALRADVRLLPLRFPAGTAFFLDPARRKNGRRIHHVEQYQPGLSVIRRWLDVMTGGGVKVSPAVDLSELRGWDCEIEFISVRGGLKEAVLWFGGMKTADRRATLLPAGESLVDSAEYSAELSAPGSYLYEPDPAVMRAGLVRSLGRHLDLKQLDESIGLLTGDKYVDTPFARCYRIVDVLPANLKKLRSALRSRNVGQVNIKKRGSAVDVEEYRRKLHLKGDEEATILLTRTLGRKITLIVELE